MILYFSGTGNSRYAAQAIQSVTGDELVCLNELIKNNSVDALHSDKPFVFVAPTYAWRMPRVVSAFIESRQFTGSGKAYIVLTCGSDTGNSVQYAKIACEEKGFDFFGLASVVMPENYIAMFKTPEKTKADKIVARALPHLLNIAEHIKKEQPLPSEKVMFVDKLKSNVVNNRFYKSVSAKGFYTTTACNGCGKCAELCSLNNINITDSKPQWGNDCTHCMACICGCPMEAIEYKHKTQGKHRYFNTEVPPSNH